MSECREAKGKVVDWTEAAGTAHEIIRALRQSLSTTEMALVLPESSV